MRADGGLDLRRCVACLTFWALLGGTTAAAAQDVYGTRSLGMGGALRAAPSGDSAVLLNPAGMTLTRAFQINSLYQYRVSDSASIFNVSVVDSVTTRVAAGLFYTLTRASPERRLALGGGKTFDLNETVTNHEAGLSLAYPLGSILHLGMTNKYVRHEVQQPANTPTSLQYSGTQGYTMDLGAVLTVIPNLNLAVTGHNLVAIDPTLCPRLLGLGASYSFGNVFLAEFDSVLDFSSAPTLKAAFHGGGELFLAQTYGLRAGAMHDMLRQATYVTAGFSLVSARIGVDFALRQMIVGGAETMVAASVRVFLGTETQGQR
jgi:hypothetical protein